MSLTTIMSHAGLSGYAIAGMLVFLALFASLMLRLWWQARQGGLEEAGRLPLEEGRPVRGAASAVHPAGPAAGNSEERR